VFEFAGWGAGITCLVQSPAVDVVAIGLADGRIMLHNLKLNKTIMSFLQDGGPVTSLSFRLRPICATVSSFCSGEA
jgi:U3 small nucleolar RNA-associated protein 21